MKNCLLCVVIAPVQCTASTRARRHIEQRAETERGSVNSFTVVYGHFANHRKSQALRSSKTDDRILAEDREMPKPKQGPGSAALTLVSLSSSLSLVSPSTSPKKYVKILLLLMPMPSARPKFFWPTKKIFGWPKLFRPSFLYRILMILVSPIVLGLPKSNFGWPK